MGPRSHWDPQATLPATWWGTLALCHQQGPTRQLPQQLGTAQEDTASLAVSSPPEVGEASRTPLLRPPRAQGTELQQRHPVGPVLPRAGHTHGLLQTSDVAQTTQEPRPNGDKPRPHGPFLY